MAVDGDVRCARVVARSLDVADRAPRKHVRNVLRQVRPRLTAVASDLHLAIVCARPNRSRFFRRFSYGENYAGVFDADVVARQSAGESLLAFVVLSQIGADDLPAIAAVGCLMNELTADVNLVVIVRRDRQRHRPHETILEICSDFAANIFRPHFDIASLSGFQVEDFDDAANAAGTRSA